MAAAAQDHRHLSDSVWLSLALTSADSEDVVCTKVAVAPAEARSCRPLGWVSLSCWALWRWEHRSSPVVWLTGSLAGEEPVGDRWAAVAVEGEEAVGDPPEEQGDLWAAEQESPLSYSTTEVQPCLHTPLLLSATMTLNIHLSVHHRMNYRYLRGVTPTGAVSGAASAAAASAGGAAPAGWRTSSRWTRPRSRRTPVSFRCGRHQVAYGARSFETGVPHSFPRRDTWLKSRILLIILTVVQEKEWRVHGLCARIQPGRTS